MSTCGNPLRNVHARKEISLGPENSANRNSHGDLDYRCVFQIEFN